MSSSDDQTSVAQSSPWGPQAQALQRGFQRAENLFQAGPQRYPNFSTVAQPSGATQQALGMQEQLARQGLSGATQAGLGQLQSTLSGQQLQSNPVFNLLGATARGEMLNGNPHLDQVIGRAGADVADQVNAQFARSGMTGSGHHSQTLARELGGLAGDLRFQNFAQERANQIGAANTLGQAFGDERARQLQSMLFMPQAESLRSLPAQQLGQVGAARDAQSQAELQDRVNRFNFEQQAPANQLAQYLGMISGNYGGTQTSTVPVSSSPALTALGGGLAGMTAFNQAGGNPWLGLGGGALLGLLGG